MSSLGGETNAGADGPKNPQKALDDLLKRTQMASKKLITPSSVAAKPLVAAAALAVLPIPVVPAPRPVAPPTPIPRPAVTSPSPHPAPAPLVQVPRPSTPAKVTPTDTAGVQINISPLTKVPVDTTPVLDAPVESLPLSALNLVDSLPEEKTNSIDRSTIPHLTLSPTPTIGAVQDGGSGTVPTSTEGRGANRLATPNSNVTSPGKKAPLLGRTPVCVCFIFSYFVLKSFVSLVDSAALKMRSHV